MVPQSHGYSRRMDAGTLGDYDKIAKTTVEGREFEVRDADILNIRFSV